MVHLHPLLWDQIHGPFTSSVVGSNPWSFYILCCGIKSMVHLHPLLWDQIHGPFTSSVVGSNPWSNLYVHPVLVYLGVKFMVPFTPCTCVCLGSNVWLHLHTVGVSIVGSNPWSGYLCLLWGQMHDPIYTLYLSLFRVKSMVPFTPCTCVNCGVKSMLPFTPCT